MNSSVKTIADYVRTVHEPAVMAGYPATFTSTAVVPNGSPISGKIEMGPDGKTRWSVDRDPGMVGLPDLSLGKVETDPNGKPLNTPGAKGDAGKTKAHLVLGDFARALNEVVKIGDFGSRKYTASGWVTVPDGINRYNDARMRHWLYRMSGEELDPESGFLHEAHEIWNALAALDLKLRAKEDTNDPGPN